MADESANQLSTTEQTIQVAKEYFKKDYDIRYNQSKEIACIWKSIKTRPNDPFPTLSFLVYDPQQKEILYRETVPKATIKWISNEELEVAVTPGRIADSKQSKSGFIYNVKLKQKRQR